MNSAECASARLLTPRGRGAVATIRVEANAGKLSEHELTALNKLFAAANGKPLDKQKVSRIAFGEWGQGGTSEELVVVWESDALEIHCHGGAVCVNRILADLAAAGFATNADPPHSLSAELANAVRQAPTLQTAERLLVQQRLWPIWVQGLMATPSVAQVQAECEEVLRWSQFGLHLTKPWQVAIVGEPNVGKSTLLNSLLGFDRSIVFDEPGTTRDIVSARTVFEGW
ncbi:MAG: GTPase, partial [Planctomycetaceae bacterium]